MCFEKRNNRTQNNPNCAQRLVKNANYLTRRFVNGLFFLDARDWKFDIHQWCLTTQPIVNGKQGLPLRGFKKK